MRWRRPAAIRCGHVYRLSWRFTLCVYPSVGGYVFFTLKVNLFLTDETVVRINSSEAQRKLVGMDVSIAVN